MRPILQSSCALAATAEEAGYRIDAVVEGRRGARVIALDDGAATLVRRLAQDEWNAARFYTLGSTDLAGRSGTAPVLNRIAGGLTTLDDELAQADVVVMVASERGGRAAEAAGAVGRSCADRGVMTAGAVVGAVESSARTVHALRPHARVLLVGADDRDLADLLAALRA